MNKTKIAIFLTVLVLFVVGTSTSNVYAAEKTLTVKVAVTPDFWNSKVTFPNGNKAEINGIGIVLLDKGIPQVFKTLTPGHNDLTFTYTGQAEADYQLKIPFLAGPGASVYQILEKVTNNGQTITYTLGVDTSIRPLMVDRIQQ